jgi:sensor histidine kinase YesM
MYFNDFDSDGYHECFFFTMSRDSVFLTIFDPLCRKGYIVSNRFVDDRIIAKQSGDAPQVKPVTLIENDQTGLKDFIFFITTGFSRHPRTLYRYIIDSDSLMISPESGTCIRGCRVIDINNDKSPEMILDTQAPGNYDQNKPYSDQYSWFMILDKNMNFIFTPKSFPKDPSFLITVPLYKEGNLRLASFFNYFGTDSINSAFLLFDTDGNQIGKKHVEGFETEHSYIFPNGSNDFATFYFLKNREGEVEEIDGNLNTIKKFTIQHLESILPIASIDADLDGQDEYIFQGARFRSIIIARSDFSSSVSFAFKDDFLVTSSSQFLTEQGKSLLYLQSDDTGIFLKYSKTPFYYLKYPFYGLMYILTLLFILLIYRLQRYRIRLKEETEKQMALLQMRAIKNQIDPHFTLNVLNSIGSLYASEKNREQADYIFGKYARLIRETVISSDQVITSLKDELDFVKNYIDLERFRCDNAFSLTMDIDPEIDLQKKIPRMLIHTFVENAIKYGLRNSEGNGTLRISIQKNIKEYLIEIEDNNAETDAIAKPGQGTGKGLLIVQELIDLYFKLEKIQIRYSLEDKLSSDNVHIGKTAQLIIPL